MVLYRQFRDDDSWMRPFAVWTFYGVVVTCASALCAHFIAPQAIGSGIPEMKTVLRGIILKEYLTVRTLISKMIALSLSIGGGLPVGREGPFVHIASVVANQLSRFVHGSKGVFENESRAGEMLAAGCAVGVACTFSAPVGVSMSVAAHYQTTFPLSDTFTSSELLFFAVMGWLIYPALISFLISCCTYPLGAGMYLGGEQSFSHTLHDFFVSCSWLENTNNSHSCGSKEPFIRANWAGPDNNINIFHSLAAFQVAYFFLSIIASTLPVPAGIFMPVFVIGAAFGRTVGELLRLNYPNGVIEGILATRVHPGIYAVAGAAAFCGAVTHTVSVAVIVFELTGQLVLLIPVMIAVLVANAVCSYLQPSIYDSIIKIKHLPYLPDIPHSSSMYHSLTAEQFMTCPAAYIAKDSTYGDLQELIYGMSHPTVPSIPMGTKRCRSSELLDYSRLDMHHTIGNVFRSITKGISKSKKETDFDLYGEERELWEKSVLKRKLDLTQVQIDPSPFQMVSEEKPSLGFLQVFCRN
ncbi:chloride transporter, ClC family [Ancylostoma ceylanicum]|uniref:Chloride transporter, ClC family n=1 Tax=Ancylostoma ceylanicum TaxID=53326 RepID=A0A0D6L9A7_9BILA|nr:chloride transporter, ClC family [Ancylostoma ceylanicum]